MSNPAQLLKGKSTAVTGGVTGIGRAIALSYISHGANVAINHFGDAKSAEQFRTLLDEATQILGSKEEAEKRVAEVPGDVGDAKTGRRLVEEVVRRWGRLDVVVSNAGICEFREFLEYVPSHPVSPSYGCLTIPILSLQRNSLTNKPIKLTSVEESPQTCGANT